MAAESAISGEYIIQKEESRKDILSAAILRQQIQNRSLKVEKSPGVYRWWFPKAQAEELLAHFVSPMWLNDRELQERTFQGTPYLALYFGISSDMSRRIRWHICGPFRSSTLRRTLRAIMAPDADDKTAEYRVNQLIDKCLWEWKYTKTVEDAECRETEELAQKKFAYPLNISKNNTMPSEWIAELKQMRADLKNK